jgi:predicted nucleic acid-binding protein
VRVITNSSPLIALSRIGRLDLLHKLYGEVTVPRAVAQEVIRNGIGQPGAEEVSRADWITTAQVENQQFLGTLERDLGKGEAEAIALALGLKADLLILDDLLARQVAEVLGLNVVGTVGVLLEARQKGVLGEVKRCLDDLIDLAGFRVSSELYLRVLQEAGEETPRASES